MSVNHYSTCRSAELRGDTADFNQKTSSRLGKLSLVPSLRFGSSSGSAAKPAGQCPASYQFHNSVRSSGTGQSLARTHAISPATYAASQTRRIGLWPSPAPARACKEPRLSCSYAPSRPTATSTPTGKSHTQVPFLRQRAATDRAGEMPVPDNVARLARKATAEDDHLIEAGRVRYPGPAQRLRDGRPAARARTVPGGVIGDSGLPVRACRGHG